MPRFAPLASLILMAILAVAASGQGDESPSVDEIQIAEQLRELGAKVERRGERFNVALRGDLGIESVDDEPPEYKSHTYINSGHPKWKGTDGDLALIKRLSNVKRLSIENLKLTNQAWKTLGELRQIEMLSIAVSPVTGVELRYFADWSHLRVLHLWNLLYLHDDHLSTVGRFENLISLTIRDAPVGNRGIQVLEGLGGLTSIDLSNTKVTGEGLRYVKTSSGVEDLRLQNCPIGDDGLTHISNLSKLRILDLRGTTITDTGLTRLKRLPLRSLHLDRTKITSAGLPELAGLEDLSDLRLGGTDVDDTAVPALNAMKSLQLLILPVGFSDDGAKRIQQALPDCQIDCEYHVQVGDSRLWGTCPCAQRAKKISELRLKLRSRD